MTATESIIKRLKNEGQRFDIVLNPPVSKSELLEFRTKLGSALPADILDFYSECNGFESSDFLFRIIPMKEILENDGFDNGTYTFAEYMVYGDTWQIRMTGKEGSYEIINGNHGSEMPVILCNSLTVFIDKYLAGTGVFGDNGLFQWAEEIRSIK